MLIIALAVDADAQQKQVQGAISVTGGSATDVLGTTSRALTVAPSLRRFEPPTADELRLIRMLDPRRYFLGPAAS